MTVPVTDPPLMLLTSTKTRIRLVLERLGVFYVLRESVAYRLYLRAFYPVESRRKEAICAQERRFYRKLLAGQSNNLIFDIGAFIGNKTAIFRVISRKVICLEPNPHCVRVLRHRFFWNRQIHIVEKGVASTIGVRSFHLFGTVSGLNTFSDKWAHRLAEGEKKPKGTPPYKGSVTVRVTTLDRLIHEFGMPTYVKIDVEGYEIEVLRGLSRRLPILSFECNQPEFTAETIECLQLLSNLDKHASFNYCPPGHPFEFASERWLTCTEMSETIRGAPPGCYEIYCRM